MPPNHWLVARTGEAVVARAAYLMAAERGWSAEEQARQVDAVMTEFKWPSPPP